MHDFFKKVYVISLDNDEGRRRREMLERHLEEIRWPFARPEYFNAVLGNAVGFPWWWKLGGGPWGCFRSHLAIIEKSLSAGDWPILILEDDVIFRDDFSARAKDYLENLPDDWGMAYFGGQHLKQHQKKPLRVNEFVYTPFNVNRTHAYALHGREFMQRVYRWLLEVPAHNQQELSRYPTRWRMFDQSNEGGHHIDHRYGAMIENDSTGIYTPHTWLAGQREGKSDVCGKEVEERWWKEGTANDAVKKEMVVVLGLHNSGSTVISHLLNGIGVHFGEALGNGPWGVAYEEPYLRAWCEEILRFPYVGYGPGKEWAEEQIASWIANHRRSDAKNKKVTGIKFPFLCDVLPSVFPHIEQDGIRIIHCCRDLDKSIQGLQRRMGDSFPADMLEKHQRFLWDSKQKFLGENPHLPVMNVDLNELVNRPKEEIRNFCNFLNLDYPSENYVEHLCDFVEKDRCHF